MEYWVYINNNQVGPMSLDDVIALNPVADTLVWHPGMPDWDKAVNLPELAHLFASDVPESMSEVPSPVSETAEKTVQEEASGKVPEEKPCPPTYLVWAILVTLLCCVVGGIPAVIYSSQVKSKYAAGDYDGALKASERAAWWIVIAFVVGLIYQPFSVAFALL